jgi:hypothetical protein
VLERYGVLGSPNHLHTGLSRPPDGPRTRRERSIRRDCHALDNRRGPVEDFSRIRLLLKEMVRELAPGFSLRRPTALMHFIPEHYTPSQEELEQFKRTAERAGVSFCWMSKWETPHTDKELTDFFGAL